MMRNEAPPVWDAAAEKIAWAAGEFAASLPDSSRGAVLLRSHRVGFACVALSAIGYDALLARLTEADRQNRLLREALEAYVSAEHVRVHQGNDQPGYRLYVWTSDWERGKRALIEATRTPTNENESEAV